MKTLAPPERQEEWVRLTVAARRLDCHAKTLKALVARGELRAFRFQDGGHWRVSEESLRELIERRGGL